MAQLNFPDPTQTQTYVEAGVMWTWNDHTWCVVCRVRCQR